MEELQPNASPPRRRPGRHRARSGGEQSPQLLPGRVELCLADWPRRTKVQRLLEARLQGEKTRKHGLPPKSRPAPGLADSTRNPVDPAACWLLAYLSTPTPACFGRLMPPPPVRLKRSWYNNAAHNYGCSRSVF